MQKVFGNIMIGICIGLLVQIGLVGCASRPARYVTVEKKVIEQKETEKGIETTVKKVSERADRNVIENSASVKSVTRITNHGAREKNSKKKVQFDRFDISPDGEKLLIPFIEEGDRGESRKGRERDYSYSQIWTLGTNGMGLTRLTTGKYWDIDPVYTSDGKYVYFSSDRGENQQKIWRVFATGTGGLTRVTTGSTVDWAPYMHPNSQVLAYSALMSGSPDAQVWTVNTTGALPTQLIVGALPIYSPDGKKLLFQRKGDDTKKWDIWVMNADGSTRTQMTTGDADYLFPRWSPDGNKIVFASNKGRDEEQEHNFDIWLMNADGSNKTQLTTNGSADDLPVFDPNGKYIYFRSNRGGSYDIWRMELATE